MDELENEGLPASEGQSLEGAEETSEAISETASEEVEEHGEPGATPPAMAGSEEETPIQEPPENNG